MRATGSKVFVEQEEYKSDSGIITTLAKQGLAVFRVVAVGPGDWNVFTGELKPMSVKVGDRVVADASVAPEICITKGLKKLKYRVIGENDIQMILDEDEDVR
jgi:co-chaperonin GroES (HSP10)